MAENEKIEYDNPRDHPDWCNLCWVIHRPVEVTT